MITPTTRANVVTRRTYNRPLDDEGKTFESWEESVRRIIGHQKWLWERALGRELDDTEGWELWDLRELLLSRKVSLSGRTNWLGGTDVAKEREACQFNCSFARTETIPDIVDIVWLLLNGCGTGFHAQIGSLSGFARRIPNIQILRSCKGKGDRGRETNKETWNADTRTWTIQFGDSAEAWAKGIGKLLAGKRAANTLILDFSKIRGPGGRLKGYGWLCSGDEQLSKALEAITEILNNRADQLLSRIDILDVNAWLGTILSSRRSAEAAHHTHGEAEWEEFAVAKKDYWIDQPQREQFNSMLVFHHRPAQAELEHIFDLMVAAGGSDPGFINAETAKRRAPWFKGVNPCGEILLANRGFCNLVEVNAQRFVGSFAGHMLATRLAARANYRQTLVNLRDGVLQAAWHENNEFLRLCGVGMTGWVTWLDNEPGCLPEKLRTLQAVAVSGAEGMALELGTQRPKLVTTGKPSGTLSKMMGTEEFGEVPEGVHRPLGKYIFNNIQFSEHDPLVEKLREAGYRTFQKPSDSTTMIVTLPVVYENVTFTTEELSDGRVVEINTESAIEQMERYKLLMDNYVQHNQSVTISYDRDEIPEIIAWILNNWDSYVGVSFLYRNDPTKTAADLGHAYLPQEVVTKEEYDQYVSQLKEFDLDSANTFEELMDDECAAGVCPVR